VTAVTPAGESFVLGNRQLLLKEGVSIALADEVAEAQEQRGCTVLFLGIGGHTRAVLSLHDPIRLGARAAVQRMYDLQIEPALVSGDHRATVEALAHHLEIAHVKAELLPEERGAEIERLAPAEATVAAIGYSPADDDALGASGVPIVLGAAGSGTSDRGVSLASHDLRDAAGALWVARETRRSMDRNLRLGVLGGAAIALLCASSVIAPALAVLACGAIDAYVLRTGMRLLRRVDLRVPRRT
jgi:Cu+-exporting ATPase